MTNVRVTLLLTGRQLLTVTCFYVGQVKAAEVVRLANQAESAKRKAERARQEESELQARSSIACWL